MTPYSRLFCVHGHFYQPPREDPWLGRILIESSAAPMRHWNERIVAESYGPAGWAHRLSGGKIIEIMNCYEWMSFNVGPTLMDWLRRENPEVYERIIEADAASCRRWGHGNAMAQVYHHAIMPLASALDKELEAAWAVMDFEKHFGRKPEGMWLAECAVDTPSLEALAREGIRFVILSPYQARAVSSGEGEFTAVSGGGFDVTKPYRVDLPSGASMAVFFYHGPLSQAVAFERLLADGENFWNRINRSASGGLLMLATDGETYGHHFPFGEMALAYVLAKAREGREGLGLCNPAAYLAANPPKDRALLLEPSSWSCAHGVERWRSDCGCTDGGHPDWNQRWRGPLREALAAAKTALDEHFFTAGKKCFVDPAKALKAYGRVLADRGAATAEGYAREHIREEANLAWKLLTMQEQGLAAFASCAWFFDDISRIEPVNGMTYMWRAIELAAATGGPELRESFKDALAKAVSNKPEEGTGADILTKRVMPRRQNEASLCLLALTLMDTEGTLPDEGGEAVFAWPAFSLKVTIEKIRRGEARIVSGKAFLGTPLESGVEPFVFTWNAPGVEHDAASHAALGASEVTVILPGGEKQTRTFASLPRHAREYAALRLVESLQEETEKNAGCPARHLLSILDAWEEGQYSMPRAWDWMTVAPHLLVACVTDPDAEEFKREQAAAFLQAAGICSSVKEQAWRMVVRMLLRELKRDTPDWRRLAAWVNRARKYLPEINLWAVQNVFAMHTEDNRDKALLGAALGF